MICEAPQKSYRTRDRGLDPDVMGAAGTPDQLLREEAAIEARMAAMTRRLSGGVWTFDGDRLVSLLQETYRVHIHDVPMTRVQRDAMHAETGQLIATKAGGITSRGAMARIAKGFHAGERIETNKPAYIRDLVDSWPDESTIIWCIYNDEQDQIAAQFPEAANITGETPYEERERLIDDFKSGRRRVMISKPKILGFGLNLQIATRQVFSGLQDSYESYYQAVKRSNRYGSTKPLNVHIPITDIERPMIDTVLTKASRVQNDTDEQERIFKELAHAAC